MAVEPRYSYSKSITHSGVWEVFDGGAGRMLAECSTEEDAQQIVTALNSNDQS